MWEKIQNRAYAYENGVNIKTECDRLYSMLPGKDDKEKMIYLMLRMEWEFSTIANMLNVSRGSLQHLRGKLFREAKEKGLNS